MSAVIVTWLEFFAAITHAVAWPVAAVLLGLIFRRHLVSLLQNVTHLKAPGVELTFGDQLAAVEEKAELLAEQSDAPRADLELKHDADPTGLMLRAWQSVEEELSRIMSNVTISGFQTKQGHASRDLISAAIDAGILLDPDAIGTIHNLRQLRNKVAHGRHVPTRGQAHAYVKSSTDLISYLKVREDWVTSHGKG